MAKRVYDDEYENRELLDEFCGEISHWLYGNFANNIKSFTDYGFGGDRISEQKVFKSIKAWYEKYMPDVLVSTICHHAYNIGNNNEYELFEVRENEQILIGYLNLIDNMYGSVYLYVTDCSSKKKTVFGSHHLSWRGVSKE